jgi:hypothetical protein
MKQHCSQLCYWFLARKIHLFTLVKASLNQSYVMEETMDCYPYFRYNGDMNL